MFRIEDVCLGIKTTRDLFYCMLPTKNSTVHVLKGRFKQNETNRNLSLNAEESIGITLSSAIHWVLMQNYNGC